MNIGMSSSLPLTNKDPNPKTPKRGSTGGSDKDKAPDWHKRNPGLVSAWHLPKGKHGHDFFDPKTLVRKKNLAQFPIFKHHQTNIYCEMCLSYQWKKPCRKGSKYPRAHTPPEKMTTADKATCTNAFKTSYG